MENKIYDALAKVGMNEETRTKMVELCRDIETQIEYKAGSIRDEITGPIVDALHNDHSIVRKHLSNGLTFDFYYRTKIARDFVMSIPEVPNHVWEPQTTKLLLHLSKDAKNIIVGGAYFGDQAIMMAKEISKNNGFCHAFEPNLDQVSMLKHNAELNHINNLKAWRKGLWKDSRSLLHLVGEDSFAHAEVVVNTEEVETANSFPTVSIDEYVEENGIEQLDLIMIDVEGLEYSVLQGAAKQIRLPKGLAPNIVFEVHRSYVDWSGGLQNSDIVKYLTSHGYTVFAVRDYNSNEDMNGLPIEIIPPECVYLEGPPHGFNMMAIKDVSIIESPLFKKCYDVSPKLLRDKNPDLHQPTK